MLEQVFCEHHSPTQRYAQVRVDDLKKQFKRQNTPRGCWTQDLEYDPKLTLIMPVHFLTNPDIIPTTPVQAKTPNRSIKPIITPNKFKKMNAVKPDPYTTDPILYTITVRTDGVPNAFGIIGRICQDMPVDRKGSGSVTAIVIALPASDGKDLNSYKGELDPDDPEIIIVEVKSTPSSVTDDPRNFEFIMSMQMCTQKHRLRTQRGLEELKTEIACCGECQRRNKGFKKMIAFQETNKTVTNSFKLRLRHAVHNRHLNGTAAGQANSLRLSPVAVP